LQRSRPDDAEEQLLALYEEFKVERAASEEAAAAAAKAAEEAKDDYLDSLDPAAAAAAAGGGVQPRFVPRDGVENFSPHLVVFNAVLNSLVVMG
jgi:membrane protein involved in colicin uptake